MCTPIINMLANTITTNLRQIAGMKTETVAGEFGMTDQQKAYKVLMSIIDLIKLMIKEDGETSSQFGVINNISGLSLKLFIDILNNRTQKIEKTPFDEIARESYAKAIEILINEDLFDTKNDLMIAKSLVVE